MQHKLGGFQAWLTWGLAVSFVVVVFTLQTGYAITNSSVAGDLQLTIAQVGLVGSAYTWMFAFSQLFSGNILDRFGARWVLPISCLIVSLGAICFAHSTSFGMLIASNLITAIGASFGFIGAGFVGARWFQAKHYGIMFALVQFVVSLSAILGQQTLSLLIQEISWTHLINALAYIGLGAAALMSLFFRFPEEASIIPWTGLLSFFRDLRRSLGSVLSTSGTWKNCLVGGAIMGSMLAIGIVWGARLLIAGGMSEMEAFKASSWAWAGLAFGAPFFAKLSDWMKSRVKPLTLGCLLQFVMIVFIMYQAGTNPSHIQYSFFAFGFMAGASMLSFTIQFELVDRTLTGVSAAAVNATQFVMGGVLMAVPGKVLSSMATAPVSSGTALNAHSALEHSLSNHIWAMSIIPFVLLLSVGLCLVSKETYGQAK